MRYKSNERVVLLTLRGQLVKKLKTVGLLLKREMKMSMRGKGPPASLPGEIPHVRSGTLKRSIFDEVDVLQLILRVGTNLKYGMYLELGTPKMKARPWIRPALKKKQQEIKVIFLRG